MTSRIEIQALQSLKSVIAALAYADADPYRRVREVQFVGVDPDNRPLYDLTLEHFEAPSTLQQDIAFPRVCPDQK